MRREIMTRIAEQKTAVELKSLARPPEFIIETMNVSDLLNLLVSHRIHLAIVLNEYGDFTGIVTMEDAIETLLGREILDEFDQVVDMREYARKRRSRFWRKERGRDDPVPKR